MTTFERLSHNVPNTSTENTSCHTESTPTNHIRDKIVTYLDNDVTDENTDDPLYMLEVANLKSLLTEEISFRPASRNVDEELENQLNILEKAGLLIRLDTRPAVPRGTRQSKSVPSSPTPLPPLFDPSCIKMDWTRPRRMGVGLYNIGNTCFINSVLQCLTYTPPLGNYMFSKDHTNSCKLNGFCAMCQFQKHYFHSQQFGSCPIRPNSIVQYLNKIAPSFHLGRQEDSHEFLRYIIDAMQNSCLSSITNKIHQEQKYTTVIHQIFGGKIRSQVTCSNCNTRSDTFEPMLDLSLNIKNCGNLLEALRRATMPDTLDGNNSYFCDKCKRKGIAQKILSIHSPPRVLTIHLKRFSYGSQLGIKLQTRVTFPSSLNIRPYMTDKQGSPIPYSLYGVLVHAGLTCNSGHYYCFVIGPNGSWYKLNDTYVGAIGQSMVLNCEAYMLFYKQEITQQPTKSNPTNTLIIDGLGTSQPSPLARNTQQKKTFFSSKNNFPSTCPLSAQLAPSPRTPVTAANKISFMQCLQELTPTNNGQQLLRDKNLNIVSPNSKNRIAESENSKNITEPATNQIAEKLAPKQPTNQAPDKENSESPNQIPASTPIATVLSQKDDSINIYKAGTTKPVAVVTPKQPDTPRTQSSYSSTAVHRNTAFKSPSNQIKGPFEVPNFYRSKRKQDGSPKIDTDTLFDKVSQAQRVKPHHRQLFLPGTDDIANMELTPHKKRKVDGDEVSPAKQNVNKVSPIPINNNNNTENKQTNRNPLQIERVNKSFAITGVKGVKPTGVITPLSHSKPIKKETKLKFLKKLHSGKERSKYVTKALKRGLFSSEVELERELSEYTKNRKASKSKKVKRKTKKVISETEEDCSNSFSIFDVTSSPEANKSPKHNKNKNNEFKSHNSSSTLTTKDTNRNAHKNKSPRHSSSKNITKERNSKHHSSHRDTASRICDRDTAMSKRTFQTSGDNVKSWESGQESLLNFMNSEKKKEFSDSETDLELNKGRVHKKKRKHLDSRKSVSSQFQAEYDRTN